jgi:nickel superoxide dismutase
MKRVLLTMVLAVAGLFALASHAQAHCQVPCGIYDDHARIHAIREDIKTIHKAVKKIRALSKKSSAQSKNQLVRWVVTKEAHAEKIIRVISDYFLTQKIKAVSPKSKGYKAYLTKLARHHSVLRAAMKTKQKANLKAVAGLTRAVNGIAGYWGKK